MLFLQLSLDLHGIIYGIYILIISLYILTPVYRVFIKNADDKELKYLFVIIIIFSAILPSISYVLKQINFDYCINFEIVELTGYSGYYFAGYYLSKKKLSKNKVLIISSLAVVSFLITFEGTIKLSLLTNTSFDYLFGNLLPTTMSEAFCIFLLFRKFEDKEFSQKTEKAICFVSNSTFGIYLIHELIRVAFEKIGLTSSFINPIIAIPLVSILVFFISLLIISLLKRVKLFRKIL